MIAKVNIVSLIAIAGAVLSCASCSSDSFKSDKSISKDSLAANVDKDSDDEDNFDYQFDFEGSDSIVRMESNDFNEVKVDETFSYKKVADGLTWNTISCEISADFATKGNAALVDSVNSYITHLLGDQYKGDVSNHAKVINFWTKYRFKNMRAQWGKESNYSYESKITFDHATDKYITYLGGEYSFEGGENGLLTFNAASFRKSDGAQLSWEMFDKDNAEFKRLIKEGLKPYFSSDENKKAMTDEEFKSHLLSYENFIDVNNLPLPSAGPYFSKDGLVIHYKQNEIARYEYGCPQYVMSFETAKKYLKEPGYLE